MIPLTLFFKECKTICKSIIYIAFIGAMILFYTSQIGGFAESNIKQYYTREEKVDGTWVLNPLSNNPLIEPQEGEENYGYKYADIPEQIIPEAISELAMNWKQNYYRVYNFIGMGRTVNLSEKKQAEIAQIIFDITGINAEELYNRVLKIREQNVDDNAIPHWENIDYQGIITIKITYEEYKEKVKQIDKVLGGMYSETNLQSIERANVPITYEEKLAEYNAFINEDKITGAYARLFCDYMSIIAGMLSVFVPAAFLMREKRAKVRELIFSREISSAKYIIVRYTAIVIMLVIPFLLLSIIPSVQLVEFAVENNLPVDVFGFAKYIIAWILPTLMTTTAVAFILMTVTDTPIAIAVQFLWCFLNLLGGFFGALSSGTGELIDYGSLIIRHNSVGHLQILKDNFTQLAINRIFYAVLSLALVTLTIFIYEQKRRGILDVRGILRKIFRNRKSAD